MKGVPSSYVSTYLNAVKNNSFSLPVINDVLQKYTQSSLYNNEIDQYNTFGYRVYSCDVQLSNYDINVIGDKVGVTKTLNDITIRVPDTIISHSGAKQYCNSNIYGKYVSIDEIISHKGLLKEFPAIFIGNQYIPLYTTNILQNQCTFKLTVHDILSFIENSADLVALNDANNLRMDIVFIPITGVSILKTNKYILSDYNYILPREYVSGLDASIMTYNNPYMVLMCDSGGKYYGAGLVSCTINNDGVSFTLDDKQLELISTHSAVDFIFIDNANIKHAAQTKVKLSHTETVSSVHTYTYVVEILADNDRLYSPSISEKCMLITLDFGDADIKLCPITNYTNPNTYPYCKITASAPSLFTVVISTKNEITGIDVSYFHKETTPFTTIHQNSNIGRGFLKQFFSTDGTYVDGMKELLKSSIHQNEYLAFILKDRYKYTDPSSYIAYDNNDYYSQEMSEPSFTKYKIESFAKVIGASDSVYYQYIQRLPKYIHRFYLSVSNIDLSSRIRYNCSLETGESFIYEFNEPCYMFSIHNSMAIFLDLRVFIDGMICIPKCLVNKSNMEYIYIPTRLVSANSFIEISAQYNIYKKIDHIFTSVDDVFDINLKIGDTSPKPIIANICVYNDDTQTVLAKSSYDINAYDEDNYKYSITDADYAEFSKIGVSVKSAEYTNINTSVVISKQSEMTELLVTKDGVVSAWIDEPYNDCTDNYRVYINGRLAPPGLYTILARISNKRKIRLNAVISAGNRVIFEKSPFKWKQIASIKEIGADGRVELDGVIDHPFNLEYMEVYLNGIRVPLKNISVLSPSRFRIYGMNSIMNLWIYERECTNTFYNYTYAGGLIPIPDGVDTPEPTDIVWKYMKERLPEDVILNTDNINNADNTYGITSEQCNWAWSYLSKVTALSMADTTIDNSDNEADWSLWNSLDELSMEMIAFTEEYVYTLDGINPDINQLEASTVTTLFPAIRDNKMVNDGSTESGLNTMMLFPDSDTGNSGVIRIGDGEPL